MREALRTKNGREIGREHQNKHGLDTFATDQTNTKQATILHTVCSAHFVGPPFCTRSAHTSSTSPSLFVNFTLAENSCFLRCQPFRSLSQVANGQARTDLLADFCQLELCSKIVLVAVPVLPVTFVSGKRAPGTI